MDEGLKFLLLWGLGIFVLFGGIIFLGLRNLKKMTIENQSMRFSEVKQLLPDRLRVAQSFLYGVFQNFSASEPGFAVRSSSDREMGKIVYRTGRRTGWLEVNCMGQPYLASTLNTWGTWTVVFHKAGDETSEKCIFRRKWFQVTYEIPGIGIVESKAFGFWGNLNALRREYFLDGNRIGFFYQEKRSQYGTRILGIDREVSLPYQMFMLAMG